MAAPEVAESTVAMSLYNVAAGEGVSTLEGAREALARHGLLWPLSALEKALEQLVERGYAVVDDGRFGVTGPRGHVVVTRDRSDPTGWSGWKTTQHAQARTAPLVGRLP